MRWANHAQNIKTTGVKSIIEIGDIDQALTAANVIGDDRLQKEARGYSLPESFTHGTSAKRMYWFKKGFTLGDINEADTFSANKLD